MIRSSLLGTLATGLIVSIGGLTSLNSVWAVHPNNAGPDKFEIRFKLPPPKPLSPEEELATFKLAPGFHAELVASEPMVNTPVSVCWDEKGRMFVCEMRAYMHDTEGTGEDAPTGRIVMLEDSDGDGKMDKRTVFADHLVLPRAILWVNGGLLVGEPPNLSFLKDTDGDGVADLTEVLEHSFGKAGGQPEHMANSPTWMLDNWIYFANHVKRYQLKDGKFRGIAAEMRGQWGLTQDNFGRLFYNTNSDFLRANLVPDSLGKRNLNYPSTAGLGIQVLKDQSTWPSHPTPGVNRGYQEKKARPDGTFDPAQLREDGSLASSTATCGPAIYRGTLFPREYRGNAFIPEPAGNLVKRVIITEKNGTLVGANANQNSEFWTSTDERFRPVNAYSGPDGALYVIDMYRGIIQHKSFLTHYLVENILNRKLETPFEQGRIWRIVPDKAKPVAVKLPGESEKLVEFLGHEEGWVRDTAQRLLVERKDPAIVPALAAMALNCKTPLGKIHALWAMDGIGGVPAEVITASLKDPDAKVRATAVRLTAREQVVELKELIKDSSADVQLALAFQLSAYPETQEAAITLAMKSGNQPLIRDGILSGLAGRELEVLQALVSIKEKKVPSEMLEALAQAVMNERQKERVKSLLGILVEQASNSPNQLAMLTGASGKSTTTKSAPKPKLLTLDSAPPELAALMAAAAGAAKPLVSALDARLSWPTKPGAPAPRVVIPLTASEQALFGVGEGVYNTLCIGCHQPTGAGMEGLAPALVDSEWVLGSPDVLPKILLHGLSGPIKVGNQSWNLEMPPLGASLSDEQIAGVLTYIRRQWEHSASPISTASVAQIRKEHATRTKAWTGPELQPIAPKKAPETKPGH